jgi:multisubunit Na+/H+ antiporter MnhB subunit
MNLILSPPLLGFVVGTRVALAFGLGLLVSDRIPARRRRTLGFTLVAIGAVTTIPAAMSVFGRRSPSELPPGVARSE